MAGAIIFTRIESKAPRRVFAALSRVMANPTPVMAAIGTGLVESTHERFERAVDPGGQAWAPLLPAYAAIKRGPGILRAAGMAGGLMGSITRRAGRDRVEVGTNKIYAGVHQHGATIRANKAKALVFRLAGGMVMAKSVTIPARPFLGLTRSDEDMILDMLQDALERATAAGPT